MRKIGIIKFVQIQQDSLKESSGDGRRIYNPSQLLRLPKIQLTPDGIIGFTDTDQQIVDVHHKKHPNSRHRGDNPISIGFTSHYDMMRKKISAELTDGIAGENIIIETDSIWREDDLGSRIAITINNQQINLTHILPIPPCEPFSRFTHKKPITPHELKTTLQFLSHGTRGFYMHLESTENIMITAGSEVYVI